MTYFPTTQIKDVDSYIRSIYYQLSQSQQISPTGTMRVSIINPNYGENYVSLGVQPYQATSSYPTEQNKTFPVNHTEWALSIRSLIGG